MKFYQASSNRRLMQLAVLAVVVTALCSTVRAQEEDKKMRVTGPRGCPAFTYNSLPMKTFYLHNVSQPQDGNELLTGLRLMLDPETKLYLMPTQDAIVIRGCPEELTLAQKLLDDLDRPHKKFRLTYTLTEMDGANKIGVQHVSIFVEEGQRTTLKNGSKVPIVTGSYSQTSSVQQQMTYLDVGMNFDVTVTASGNEITLKSKVEQSSVAEEKSGVGPQDPIVRQTVLENVSLLTPEKPQVLGSVDITGTTRRLEIEVVADTVK